MKNPLDLNEKYPGYFNKTVFRAGIILITFFAIVLMLMNGIQNQYYIMCDVNNIQPCKSILYACANPPEPLTMEYYNIRDTCNSILKHNWSNTEKNKEFLQPGEVLGNPPPTIVKHSLDIILIMLVLMFIINHIIYKRKKKNGS